MEFIEKLLESVFLFRRPFQLQKHVLHREIAGDGAEVVRQDRRFRARVAAQRDAICFVNALGDARARVRAGLPLRKSRRRGHQSREDHYGEEPRLAKHGSLLLKLRLCPRHISARTSERRAANLQQEGASLKREYSMAGSPWAENSYQDVLVPDQSERETTYRSTTSVR